MNELEINEAYDESDADTQVNTGNEITPACVPMQMMKALCDTVFKLSPAADTYIKMLKDTISEITSREEVRIKTVEQPQQVEAQVAPVAFGPFSIAVGAREVKLHIPLYGSNDAIQPPLDNKKEWQSILSILSGYSGWQEVKKALKPHGLTPVRVGDEYSIVDLKAAQKLHDEMHVAIAKHLAEKKSTSGGRKAPAKRKPAAAKPRAKKAVAARKPRS